MIAIQNEDDLEKFVVPAIVEHESIMSLYSLEPMEMHDKLINNPILHDNFVYHDVLEQFRYLCL